jgi:hypothetical protein
MLESPALRYRLKGDDASFWHGSPRLLGRGTSHSAFSSGGIYSIKARPYSGVKASRWTSSWIRAETWARNAGNDHAAVPSRCS